MLRDPVQGLVHKPGSGQGSATTREEDSIKKGKVSPGLAGWSAWPSHGPCIRILWFLVHGWSFLSGCC